MSIRRRTSITREGYYYLFILAFIAGGAVMRQINPLFALAGLMLAPLLFNWRIAMAEIRGLIVTRRTPRVAAGETLVVDVRVHNNRPYVAAWQVRVVDQLFRLGAPEASVKNIELIVPYVPPQGMARVSYRCRVYQRGEYRLGPAAIATGFPFGLILVRRRLRRSQRLLVTPRLGVMQESWRRYVREDRNGTQGPSHRRGAVDGDFFALRSYRSGDPPRSIHWRSSARLGQLMVKQVEQRSDRQITLLLELWCPSSPTDDDLLAVEKAVSFAASAVTDLCRAAGGKLTLSISAREPLYYSGGLSPALRTTTLDYLAVAQPTEEVDAFQAWLEAGAGGGGGSTDSALLVSTRPAESLDEIDSRPLPDWVGRVPRVSVRDPAFGRWFRLIDRPAGSAAEPEAASTSVPTNPMPDSRDVPATGSSRRQANGAS